MDGQQVPFLIANENAAVTPPILTGHGVDSAHQVVLGAATMAQFHKRLGQYITVTYGAPANAPIWLPPTRLRIVGTATFPAIGFASTVSDHTSMGTGALLALQVLPKPFAAAFNGGPTPALDGPNLALVRMRPGVPAAVALANLQRIVAASDRVYASAEGGAAGNALVVQGVQRPAEIVNYKTIGLTPTLFVSGLALGAVVALALTLIASVRQRRRDLALLKTIGFVRRQLAAAVAWQATVAALVGIVVGIPLGVIVGPLAVGSLRGSDLRRAIPHGVRTVDFPGCARHARARQRRRGRSRPDSGAHADSGVAKGGVKISSRGSTGGYRVGTFAAFNSRSARSNSAARCRRAASAAASCSPVGCPPPERKRWSASTANARPRRLSAHRAHRARPAWSGAEAAARSSDATASSTWTLTSARRCGSSPKVSDRTSSRASSAAVTAGPTERCQSAARPWRRLRAISKATRMAARAMATARRTQPQVFELDDVEAFVVVVVGCDVVVLGRRSGRRSGRGRGRGGGNRRRCRRCRRGGGG